MRLFQFIAFAFLLAGLLFLPVSMNRCYVENRNEAARPAGTQTLDRASFTGLDFVAGRLPDAFSKVPHARSIFFYRAAVAAAMAVLLLGMLVSVLLRRSALSSVLMLVLALAFIFCQVQVDDFKNFYFEYCWSTKLFHTVDSHPPETLWAIYSWIAAGTGLFQLLFLFRKRLPPRLAAVLD